MTNESRAVFQTSDRIVATEIRDELRVILPDVVTARVEESTCPHYSVTTYTVILHGGFESQLVHRYAALFIAGVKAQVSQTIADVVQGSVGRVACENNSFNSHQ